MSWVKVDDKLHAHPKSLDAGLEAMGFWVLCLSWCGEHLTDGHIKRSAAERIACGHLDRLSSILVRVRLWDVHPSGDGWQFHDYHECNWSRAKVLKHRTEVSKIRKEAGRRGGEARAEARRRNSGKQDGKGDGNGHGNGVANDQQTPQQTPSQKGGPVPVPVPSPEPVARPDPEPTNTSAPPPVDPVVSTSARSDVDAVFGHWVIERSQLTGCKPSTLKPTSGRRSKIQARLREGYSVDDLKLAVDGMFATPFNIEKHYTDVTVACGSATQVDRYMALAKTPTNGAATEGDDSFIEVHLGQELRRV